MTKEHLNFDGNGVLVCFSREDKDHNPTTSEEPYYLTGQCRDMSGWTVNRENCVEPTNPYHKGYWTGHSHTDDVKDWDRFFDCPVQYLAVKLTRTEDSDAGEWEKKAPSARQRLQKMPRLLNIDEQLKMSSEIKMSDNFLFYPRTRGQWID
ncbi:hypothetical protein Pcinc_007714 [Petrolisthes cinctipes]|uniref:Uncharacterized protein n=1 Tax=Petrolisthes cinctipes TaxID=88211 RepID=A0AAE1GEN9_PETCI|nr:hypothetical protein Pcinc_007714 [Petrolisthes cinctipes]